MSEAFFARAESHKLAPKIINSKSNFVVVTYWWGRGNLNKNTQRPCPEDVNIKVGVVTQPITYEKMIENWEHACTSNNCNYLAEEYPEFAVKGGYQHAINFKPHFIELALKACYPRGVLYIDGDMKIKLYPSICDMKNIDYMARGWNSDLRPSNWKTSGKFCFDPYVFEMSGGTMFFGNTRYGRELLHFWQSETKKYPGKADDRILSLAMMRYDLLVPLTTIQLPIEYLWLDMDYDKSLTDGKDYKKEQIAITHPECLTSEDRATEEGASKDRYPPRYAQYTDDKLYCDWEEIYEYIHFDSKNQIGPFKQVFNWLELHEVADIIPFSKKYGPFNKIAEHNENALKHVDAYVREKVVIVSPHNYDSIALHKINADHEIIPTILRYIEQGQAVIYVPGSSRSIRNVLAMAMERELDLVTKNISKVKKRGGRPNYTLDIDKGYPIFFGTQNNTLKHLLRMSESITALEKLFNRSYLFLTRIRCGWT